MKYIFEKYETDARMFVKEVASELQAADDQKMAVRVMTAVLHTIRDILTVEESLHLISQLPLYVKGIYVNDWHLGEKIKMKNTDEFVTRLLSQNARTSARDFGDKEKAIEKTKCVMKVLRKHISQGEIEDMISQFPDELKNLWQTNEINSQTNEINSVDASEYFSNQRKH